MHIKRADKHPNVQELLHVLDAANELIIIRDIDGTIRYLNKGAERLFGRSHEEVIGRHIRELVHANDPDPFEHVSRGVSQRGFWRGDVKVTLPNGEPKQLHLNASLVPNNPTAVVVVGTDLTEKYELDEKFLRAQRLELVGTLSAGMAHDLNNVLTPIVLTADLFDSSQTEAELKRLKNVMIQGCLRATAIVHQLLSFSRGHKDAMLVLQTRHLLYEIVNMVRETFPERIKVEESFGGNLWPIKGNPTQFHQILMNLCVNARDAMAAGGTLTLTAENITLNENFCIEVPEARPGEFLKLCIIDTGTGISPENLKMLWRPFFTTKPVGKGTGLGLPTVKRLLEDEHSGFLRLLTESGKGTRFELYFPSAEPGAKTNGIEYHRGNGDSILVLEPDTAVRTGVELGLEHIGYVPISARTVEEAGEHIKAQRFLPKLAILDPSVKDSITLIRAVLPGIPIVALGIQATEFMVEPGITCLMKPASKIQLACAVYRALLKKHAPTTARN